MVRTSDSCRFHPPRAHAPAAYSISHTIGGVFVKLTRGGRSGVSGKVAFKSAFLPGMAPTDLLIPDRSFALVCSWPAAILAETDRVVLEADTDAEAEDISSTFMWR